MSQPNSEELSAYHAALSEQAPAERVSALQQFLSNYPSSSLRQAAISALLAAQRQMQPGQNTPAILSRSTGPQLSPAVASMPSAATPVGPQKDSLLQQEAKEAQITVAARKLEIRADNSALSQILHEISGSTGMKVEGLSKDERIFGTYGPGDAREVLLSLLEGSGYNVVMIGDLASGTPRELNLTQRAVTVSATPGSPGRRAPEEDADEDQDVQQQPPVPEPQPLPNNQSGQEQGQPQPRTPQEIMQELQRMRQQQNQNQPPPQNPQ